MDNKPLSPTSAEPEPPVAPDATSTAPSLPSAPLLTNSGGNDFPLRGVLLGPKGIYPGIRWLTYLAMAWVVFQAEGWLVVSLQSHLSVLWWRMMIEASMMLAAILPGFAMARIEGHPFGDFGLPAWRAFGRNFWVGTLWGIASLSVLMLVLRVAGASVGRVRRHPRRQSGRGKDRACSSRNDRLLPLPDAAADGRFVVGCRLSHGVGLGRKLSVLRSRQRGGSARAPAQLQFARLRLADGRFGW